MCASPATPLHPACQQGDRTLWAANTTTRDPSPDARSGGAMASMVAQCEEAGPDTIAGAPRDPATPVRVRHTRNMLQCAP